MVTLEDLCFQPAHAAAPARRLNFHCPQPGMVAVLGGNGSGKSTLAQLLAGWYPAYLPGTLSGSGQILDQPMGQRSLPEQAQTVQLVQQSPALQLSGCTFSVEEEIAFGPENFCLGEDEILARLEAALTLTDCLPLRHRHPATLSGGEAQRVVIACALAMQPRLLLLDEAFSRLTPQATQQMLTRLSAWANDSQALVILFERHRQPAQAFCRQMWQLDETGLTAL
ncbi:ABC transporter ATP-binding protein [Enterobacter sp. ENT03]|uniref:ABC transporter ATP-binding protein n=1 Tax=Enterobacter sp. ENT03 TaxID=2854780 RepID=UPI001C48A72F|nr:ABC transporter ATP-binding protein [Enterobacter sp. ENT03]MBV7406818.1 energy-coupling factor ABC transporter ATP-binding protein [Enterobacter sp. ENT03]